MDRRRFLTLSSLPLVAQLAAACGDDTPEQASGTDRESLRSDVERITVDRDPTAAAAAINDFGADLYRALADRTGADNLVISPVSISLALTMTAAGARGTTLDELAAGLRIGSSADVASIHRSMNALDAHLESLNGSVDNTEEGGSGTSVVELSIVNSLWGQAGLTFGSSFLDLLAAEYGAGLELVDYRTAPETARTAINDWVDEATQQRIPELLAEGTITTDTRLTLVNAVHLRANWAERFDESLTTDEAFAAPTGEIRVPMMHHLHEYGYAEGDGWVAVDVPYVFDGLSLLVAAGSAPDLAALDALELDEIVTGLAPRRVDLGLPRFDIGSSLSLATVLRDLGIDLAFTPSADFSGMTTDEQLMISDVVHEANITTDEDGSEAAAATAVVMVGTSAPIDEPVIVVFDRPFRFWLRDRLTGTAVFVGRVTDPSATRS